LLLTVELDSPTPDEPPRVTVRGARPLSEVKDSARMVLSLDITGVDAVQELAMMLIAGAPGRGEVRAMLHLGDDLVKKMRLGRDFVLDGELVDRIAEIEGISNVSLKAERGPSLRLVA
jgi:DNA polymerase-3 subunit alpha